MDSLILPDMYASTLQIFLDVLSNRHPNRLILLIADGAPSHRAGKEKLTIPNNIRIVEQPPYSPEMRRLPPLLLLLALLAATGGCGHKGPLYMPPPDQQQE